MLLNGSPSAGKTTLATAIQNVADVPLFHRSLDHILAGYPLRFRREDPTAFEQVMRGYVHALAAFVHVGCDVVAEAVIVPERLSLYRKALSDVPVILVGVRCRLEVAQARERARTDRSQLDLAVPWFESVHQIPYDEEIDTSDDPPLEPIARRLAALFRDPPEPRVFAQILSTAT
jgi:chloramphenicol 3-O phosphotransferase